MKKILSIMFFFVAPSCVHDTPGYKSKQTDRVSGGLSQKQVQVTIRENLNQIRHCYEQGLANYNKLQGIVNVTFTINQEGSIISISTSTGKMKQGPIKVKANLASCITRKIVLWRFPKPSNGLVVDVRYPFTLNPI